VADESTGDAQKEQGTERRQLFNEEQQAKVQELIDKKFGEGFAKAEGLFKPKLAELEKRLNEVNAELDALRSKKPAPEKGKPEQKAALDEDALQKALHPHLEGFKKRVTEMESRLKERDEQVKRFAERHKMDVLQNAANRFGAYNANTVAVLLSDRVETDPATGEVRVKAVNDQTPVDTETGDVMTVERLVESFLADPENSYLRKQPNAGGSGIRRGDNAAPQGAAQPREYTIADIKADPAKWASLTAEERKKVIESASRRSIDPIA